MSLLNVPAGKELPEDIYVVIEIPANADQSNTKSTKTPVRCSLTVSCLPPCSIRATTATSTTLCLWTVTRLTYWSQRHIHCSRGSVIRCRPVGVLKMTDEAGEDAKLVAVPHTKLSKEYDHIKDVNDLPELLKAQIAHFFEHYKDLEKANGLKLKAGITQKRRKQKSSPPSSVRLRSNSYC